MEKIDKRHSYGIILDTETVNTIIEDDGKLDMMHVLPYDFGFMVIDTNGTVYEKHSYVNEDIFCDEYALMQSAYFSNKIPDYIRDLAKGKRQLKTTKEIKFIIADLVKKYDCKFVMAHNASFDLRACNNIERWTTKSKYRYFFPYDIEIWDTLKASRSVMGKMPTYRRFCEENGYMTKHAKPQCRFTAEILYKFISGQNDFSEEHKGLEDVEIELEIYKYCKKQHKKMDIKLFKKN